ncbi:hypothetical protein H7849_17230 [Alloacidobacterium dinghuense]|uniref:Uncharacterized protein n=1 Tax=Alloacidobacterium dinghuense TaxID=2763107 RepID=A0A7G8BE79_9BACT|nr:hypothetical protein [Alloacidobacterium dinghuense]QNI30849.1 hypothetical protein H7849_17230 [Alloacidobacterium dinghuense]
MSAKNTSHRPAPTSYEGTVSPKSAQSAGSTCSNQLQVQGYRSAGGDGIKLQSIAQNYLDRETVLSNTQGAFKKEAGGLIEGISGWHL